MKNKMKKGFMLAFIGTAMFLTGCSDTENITPDETSKYDGKLEMAEGNGNGSVNIYASDVQGDEIKVLVNLTSTSDNMRRVYVTRNADGEGEEPFKWEGSGITNNGDESVNLDAGKIFTQEFVIPKSTTVKGTEVYKIWATKSKGDFRDATNSFIVGVGTITINYGGANGDSPVKTFSAKLLAAPLGDGSSESFISTVNGNRYQIKEAAEFSAYWDFGYYYLVADGASLSSTDKYRKDIVDVRDKAGLAADAKLNNCYFKKSTRDFTAEISSDLDDVNVEEVSTNEKVTHLVVGDVVEFIDNYGKKGLIKVTEVVEGYGTGAHITIDVKVQR